MSSFAAPDDDNAFEAQCGREVYFEVIFMGNAAKVTAIDSETGIEVSIVGSPRATMYSLKANAFRKLMRVMGRSDERFADEVAMPSRPGRYA